MAKIDLVVEKLVLKLAKEKITVSEQLSRFESATGMKRRTFFKYRQELGSKINDFIELCNDPKVMVLVPEARPTTPEFRAFDCWLLRI